VKKVLLTIITLAYLVTTTGASIDMHYCMGKMVEWGFGQKNSNKCSKCGMTDKAGCCHDQHKNFKLDKDNKLPPCNDFAKAIATEAIGYNYTQLTSLALSSSTISWPSPNAPPRSPGVPLYLRNCVFRI
jgi:hypothetical protein